MIRMKVFSTQARYNGTDYLFSNTYALCFNSALAFKLQVTSLKVFVEQHLLCPLLLDE